jgi:hypothetical protein
MELLEMILLIGAGAVGFVALSRRLPQSSGALPAPADDNSSTFPTDFFISDFTSTAPAPGPSSALQAWASAIFSHEGGNPGDRNVRNNNPGNLKFAGQAGAVGADPQGFAIFSSIEDGWAALYRQLAKFIQDFPGYSILQIMTRYLGGNPLNPQKTGQGDPFSYASAVASAVGVSTDATLKNTFGG